MSFEITLWDVGQGDCSTIRLPNGEYVIIDTGAIGSPVVDWIDRFRPMIHAIVLTHNDSDHAGSLASILDLCPERIRTVYMLRDRDSNDPKFANLFRLACEREKKGLRLLRLEVGAYIWRSGTGDTELYVRHPSMSGNENASTPNNTSGIITLSAGGRIRFIWAGDCSVPRVRRCCGAAQPDVLIGPHHGGPRRAQDLSSIRALQELSPKNVYISVGTGNGHGHPYPAYIKQLEISGCDVRCSQLTPQCCEKRSAAGGAIFPSHMLLGLPPPRRGTSCRGPTRYVLDGDALATDQLDSLHQEKITQLGNAMCLNFRRLRTDKSA
jgi:competence protein ComEC